MYQKNVELIREGYEAYNQGDFSTVFSLLHPDVEISQTALLPWGGVFRGHAEAENFFGCLGEYLEHEMLPQEFIEAGDHVISMGRLHGKVRANGQTFNLRVVHIWTVRAEQVVRFETYIDTPQMMRALQAPVALAVA